MVKIATAAAGAVVLAAAVAAQPTINTPASITECQPAALTWNNAQGTVRLIILPGGEVSAAPIETLPTQSGSSGTYVWTVNVASGTNITISIADDSGVPNYASPLVVLSGSSSSCLNAAASGSSSSGSASSTSSASATSSRSSSSAAAATSSMSSSAASSSASNGASNTASSSASAASSTTSRSSNAATAFSPSTAGLTVLGLAGALLPFF